MRDHDSMPAASELSLWVVVPFFNEERGITATLDALAGQTDQNFTLVLVNNASTDTSKTVVSAWTDAHPNLTVCLIDEPQKGTGAAADSGFRYAIANGAQIIARTDADCLPRDDWITNIRRGFDKGLEFVAGRIIPRTDDVRVTRLERMVLPCAVSAAAGFGRIRPSNRKGEFKAPYMMAAGNNLAISAQLYEKCGGFPRTKIEEEHEDRTLVNRVRLHTSKIGRERDVVVANSIRRVRAYGLKNTLMWYWDHKYQPAVVDIR